MALRSRTVVAALPALLCLACGTDIGAHLGDSEPRGPQVSIAPAPTLQLVFADPSDELEQQARGFLTAVFEYDARTDAQRDFLSAAAPFTTSQGLERLQSSTRANLPWRSLAARRERTRVAVDGVTQLSAPPPTTRLIARVRITTITDLATVESLEQATLVLLPTADGWRVEHAIGAGL